jgi:hypothetical protein
MLSPVEMNANGYGLQPETYTAFRTPSPPTAGGSLNDDVWRRAPRTRRFIDMVTGEPAPLDTTASVVWDESAVYVAFWAAEPTITATMTERDSLLFYENDLEIFVDGGDSYYELEFNAIGTVYEAFYVWRDAYTKGSRWDVPRFDVHTPNVHSFGGDYVPGPTTFWTGNHPRGTRWAFLDYDLDGLDVSVAVDGVLNDPTYASRGWTALVTLPWAGLADLAGGRSLPPGDGDTWGMFLGRFEQVAARDGSRVTAGWAAGAFGVADTHVPECFTQIVFDTTAL